MLKTFKDDSQDALKTKSQDISKTKVRTFRRRKSGHFEDESQDISKTKVRTFRRRKSGHFEGESQDISKTKVRTFRRRKSGHVGAVGRGDHAAHHSTSDLGVTARTTRRFRLDHAPSAAIGHQGGQYGVIELVATAHRAIGAKQRQTRQREIANNIKNLVARAFVGVA